MVETNGGYGARKGDSAPDPEEEFALVSLYDGSSPPEG